GELHAEIERLIAYHERLLGMPQRQFSLDDACACVGDYRLAHCLIATLSNWYTWRQPDWIKVVNNLDVSAEQVSSSAQLRLALYAYVNEHYQGFLSAQVREEALRTFAQIYQLSVANLEYLLALDSEEEALLVREAAQPPDAQEVATLYNQWAFEAALFNASSVRFVVDCNAFQDMSASSDDPQWMAPAIGTGMGAVMKRLCYLARRLGVYYDLAYEAAPLERAAAWSSNTLLTLTLYGPQDVTGAPQQYGLRLARLCRMLLGYGIPASYKTSEPARTRKRSMFSTAIVEAEATVHFLQRTYSFVMDANLLQLLPPVAKDDQDNRQHERDSTEASTLFDSSIEQSFSEAFMALANSQGVDGWRLEREPEPLLLDRSIFIPDFALTRGKRRIYIEILGFWTPSYRERKIQKLQQLQGRDDLLLATPTEAREAFNSIAGMFPIVVYNGQLSVTDVLQVLRERYDDFAERLAQIDPMQVRERVRREGFLSERVCYQALHCYRRSEIQRVAEQVIDTDIAFVPGMGLYSVKWMEEIKHTFIAWLSVIHSSALGEAVREIKGSWQVLQDCEDATIETLLGLWPQVQIRRDSIFEAVVELADEIADGGSEDKEEVLATEMPVKAAKKRVSEKRAPAKKRAASEQEVTQGDLWG
ncbi:MAG TPA: DUF790 family protein, partial [Ktedonobacteraceae bacterium]|nr:DUF790 family protein [Ktedonobacteraceae bacterium]